MRIRLITAFGLLSLVLAAPATAATKQEKKVADATDVVDQLLRIPEQSIPPSLLARAYAIAVIPNVVKVGFGLGARRGKGILVVRQDDNSWSNPVVCNADRWQFRISDWRPVHRHHPGDEISARS